MWLGVKKLECVVDREAVGRERKRPRFLGDCALRDVWVSSPDDVLSEARLEPRGTIGIGELFECDAPCSWVFWEVRGPRRYNAKGWYAKEMGGWTSDLGLSIKPPLNQLIMLYKFLLSLEPQRHLRIFVPVIC